MVPVCKYGWMSPYKGISQTKAKMSDCFHLFDKDGSGDLSELELENALTEMGFAQSEISEMMNAADEDGNGILSFAEFNGAW